ncbi:hypothetical protein [Oceanirhabdus sp. W0125-5]|nr:hypothetical protein [Oceanirhabdus sp. W0125-5]WBW95940.1 hypothetical protein OW730_19940 [Oceanirhabdus sp. W0125-5]
MEITILILKIILKIIEGATVTAAVKNVSEESGVSFAELVKKVPNKYWR